MIPIPPPSMVVKEVCRHESGHYVIGRCLGFKVEGISVRILDFHGAHSGESSVVLLQEITTLDAVLAYAEKRVQMLYAGSLAQVLNGNRIDAEQAVRVMESPNAASDYAKVRELVNIIRHIKYRSDLTEAASNEHLKIINDDLWLRTTDLVIKECEIIEGLGRRLAAEVKTIGKKYTLSSDIINDLPVIMTRFGKSA